MNKYSKLIISQILRLIFLCSVTLLALTRATLIIGGICYGIGYSIYIIWSIIELKNKWKLQDEIKQNK